MPGNSSGHSNNVIGRIDYHLNDRNSINGEYFFGQAITSTPNAGEPSFWNNLNTSRTQMMRAVWTYAPNSNWVNDVRFGYNRYNLADGNAECGGGNYSQETSASRIIRSLVSFPGRILRLRSADFRL